MQFSIFAAYEKQKNFERFCTVSVLMEPAGSEIPPRLLIITKNYITLENSCITKVIKP